MVVSLGTGITLPGELIFSVIGSLVGAIVFFWKRQTSLHETREKNLETTFKECQEKHDEVNCKLIDLSEQVGELRGRQEGVTQLANQVLEIVGKKNE